MFMIKSKSAENSFNDWLYGVNWLVSSPEDYVPQISVNYPVWEEKDGTLFMYVELPGVKKDSISIEAEDMVVKITAKKEYGLKKEDIKRTFTVNKKYDLSEMEAELNDGILVLKAKLKEDDKIKKIQVKFK